MCILQNVELSVEVESLRKQRAEDEERFTQMSNDLTLLRRNAQREVDSLSNEIDLLRKRNDVQNEENKQVRRMQSLQHSYIYNIFIA